MDIQGTIEPQMGASIDFTVELDTDEVWSRIEDSVAEVAHEAARDEIGNTDFGIDYAEGASNLLGDYSPGTGCRVARQFEEAVQGAVSVNDFLKDVVLEQIGEYAAGNASEVSFSPVHVDDIGRIRAIVREEIRLALTAVASQMTSVV